MKNIKNFTFWICIWICLMNSLSAQKPIVINEGERFFIGKNIDYYVDTTQNLEVQDVLNKNFTQCETEILNLGNVDKTVWMRFSVTSNTEKELYLEVNAPLLSVLEVYESKGDTSKILFSGGSVRPFKERPIITENWLLDLHITEGVPSTIYIKGQSFYPFQVPIALSSKNKLIENKQLHYLFWGIYMGIMLFAFIYNFFIYLSVRERSYLYYLLYILSSVAFYLGLEGFGFQFLWSNSPGFNPLIPVLVSFTNSIITLFTLRFLRINKDQKILYYWAWAIIIIFILITILNLAGIYVLALALSQMFSLVACIYFIVAGIISLKRKVPTAKYFLIGWSAFLIMVIMFILALNNVVPSNFFTTHGIFIGHMTEVVLLSFALADRINVLKTENEKKQKEIIIHLEENQQLQTKVNRELEQKVTERTAEVVAQKERSDELLLNILPAEVAEELKEKGSAEAKMINQVTVLFTDIKGFTNLSEKLSAQQLVSELNYCFSAFDNIMQAHGIEKIKTIGDSYMAAGGLPTPNKTHAVDVVKACREIQKFMGEYKKSKMSADKTYFEMRIGVNTGSVVAGIVGLKKFAYDIWGDTVNIASRMESNGEIGKINISQSTYDMVKDQFHCVHRGKITVKGKGELDMYFVES
jgi:class 3 adenylate cyclase